MSRMSVRHPFALITLLIQTAFLLVADYRAFLILVSNQYFRNENLSFLSAIKLFNTEWLLFLQQKAR